MVSIIKIIIVGDEFIVIFYVSVVVIKDRVFGEIFCIFELVLVLSCLLLELCLVNRGWEFIGWVFLYLYFLIRVVL